MSLTAMWQPNDEQQWNHHLLLAIFNATNSEYLQLNPPNMTHQQTMS